jgi:hypothetical protein
LFLLDFPESEKTTPETGLAHRWLKSATAGLNFPVYLYFYTFNKRKSNTQPLQPPTDGPDHRRSGTANSPADLQKGFAKTRELF